MQRLSVPDITGYRQIKAEVFRRIRAGNYGPGELLPGEVELAAEFGCARATVNRAMQELSDDGIIDRRRKGGSRVKASPLRQVTFEIPIIRAEIESRNAKYRYQLIFGAVEEAPAWLSAKWQMPAKTRIKHLLCLHFADEKPFQLEDRWISLSAVPQAAKADFATIGPNEWLVAEVPYTNAEISFSAQVADDIIAAHLATKPQQPLFCVERTTWLALAPVTFVRLFFAPGYEMIARY
jgi:GntR family transcriptional regulator, histidine utilization repressor